MACIPRLVRVVEVRRLAAAPRKTARSLAKVHDQHFDCRESGRQEFRAPPSRSIRGRACVDPDSVNLCQVSEARSVLGLFCRGRIVRASIDRAVRANCLDFKVFRHSIALGLWASQCRRYDGAACFAEREQKRLEVLYSGASKRCTSFAEARRACRVEYSPVARVLNYDLMNRLSCLERGIALRVL